MVLSQGCSKTYVRVIYASFDPTDFFKICVFWTRAHLGQRQITEDNDDWDALELCSTQGISLLGTGAIIVSVNKHVEKRMREKLVPSSIIDSYVTK